MKGVIELSYRSRLKLSGEGVADFLHNICTNDIKNLETGRRVSVAFLDKFGKVIAVSSVYNMGDYFLIESDVEAHPVLLKYLSDRSKLIDCKIEDLKNSHRMISVFGFENKFLDIDLSEKDIIEKELNGADFIITKNCFMDRVDFFIPAQSADGFPQFLFMKGGFGDISMQEYEQFRIENCLPEFGKDYDQNYMVLELGLEGLINYDKGCYIGQEIVARMKTYSGQVPRKIVKLTSDVEIKPKDKLFKDEQEVGFVTSVGKGFCLATIKKGFFDKGTELELESGEKVIIV